MTGPVWVRTPQSVVVDQAPAHDAELCAEDDEPRTGCVCGCNRCVGIIRESEPGSIVYRRKCICPSCDQECTNFRGRDGAIELGVVDRFFAAAQLNAAADLFAVRTVIDAWTIPGVAPAYHWASVEKLRREWPMLARAIELLVVTCRGK